MRWIGLAGIAVIFAIASTAFVATPVCAARMLRRM